MKIAPIPIDEDQRILALQSLNLLDTPAEERFDRITRLAQRIFGVPIALISLVDSDRQWFKSKQGLDASETSRDFAFCAHSILGTDALVVNDATTDDRFFDNPLVTGDPNIRFYAGQPLQTLDGIKIGTFCVLDHVPRELREEDKLALKDLAALVQDEINFTQIVEIQTQNEAINRELADTLVQHSLVEEQIRLRNEELVQANDELKIARASIEASSSGVVIADAQRNDTPVIFVNQTFETITGYCRDEIVGKNCRFLQGADRHQPSLDILRTALRSNQSCTVEIRNYRKDGSLFWNELSVSPVIDENGVVTHFIGILNDITGRKESEQALVTLLQNLETSESRFRSLIEAVPGVIVSINSDGEIAYVNKPVIDVFGYRPEELIGQSLEILIPETLRNLHSMHRASYITEPTIRQMGKGRDLSGRRKDGSIFPIEIGLGYVKTNSGNQALAFVSDITNRREYEMMREKLLNALKSSNRDLEEFAYIVAHDLKAPLRAIGSIASWFDRDYRANLDDEGKELVDLLVGRTQRMEGLIDGVLKYSRINQERTKYDQVNLQLTIQTVVEVLSPPEHIKINVDPDLPIIMGDQIQLSQLFQNLISNAIKFMDKPEGQIDIVCDTKPNEVIVKVRDNGPGIEKQYFERIFEIFETLEARDEFESTGIGLTIVKKIVNLHHGTVDVESELGHGTTFIVTLPLKIMELYSM